ncbi:MAG: argininosuccinate lyase, partial [Comamonadaceae bacterium]
MKFHLASLVAALVAGHSFAQAPATPAAPAAPSASAPAARPAAAAQVAAPVRDEFFWLGEMNKATAVIN